MGNSSENKLHVGQLSYNTTSDSLGDFFSQCGNVVSSKIIMDRDTGRSKGFGFVEMSNSDEASECVKRLNGQEFEGRQISVSIARPQEPRSSNRGGGGGNYNSRSRY